MQTLKKSESEKSFFILTPNLTFYAFVGLYLLVLVLMTKRGHLNNDPDIENVVFICFFDIATDLFGIVPSWKRRQMLILDIIIRQAYSSQELWHESVYNYAFSKERMKNKEPTMNELNHENKLIREAYGLIGTDIIRHEID